jgi:hypothetical protein
MGLFLGSFSRKTTTIALDGVLDRSIVMDLFNVLAKRIPCGIVVVPIPFLTWLWLP